MRFLFSTPQPKLEQRMDGVLNINKPSSLTSHDVVDQARRILKEKKVGHMGTLDPLATGVLPLVLGGATRLAEFAGGTKEYEACCLLGRETDSGDISGRLLNEKSTLDLAESEVRRAVLSLAGITEQVPPMLSAVKKNGAKLYELARKGIVVEREARPIRIEEAELLEFRLPRVVFRVVCSGGTYVRVLCESLGELLGVGGCMETLRRTRVGNFKLSGSITLEQLKEKAASGKISEVLSDAQCLVSHLPGLRLEENEISDLCHGKKVKARGPMTGLIRILNSRGRLCAVGLEENAGEAVWLKPVKVFGPEGLS
jgi:tRNA pseudouridine55 synthase